MQRGCTEKCPVYVQKQEYAEPGISLKADSAYSERGGGKFLRHCLVLSLMILPLRFRRREILDLRKNIIPDCFYIICIRSAALIGVRSTLGSRIGQLAGDNQLCK